MGLLCGAQQLCGASLVEAVLRDDAAKFNEHPPVGSKLPRAGDKLVLALKQNRNVFGEGRRKKKTAFPARQGRVQEAQICSGTRKGLGAKFTSNQEELISSALHKYSWCHSYKSGVTQGFQQALGSPVTGFHRAREE